MGAQDKTVAVAESRHCDPREFRLRALDATCWWLDMSRHERDEASGVWMARYIRATADALDAATGASARRRRIK